MAPVDFEQEDLESSQKLLEDLEDGAEGEGSPSKRPRVVVPEDLDADEDVKTGACGRHSDTLMGKIARQCLSKAIRTQADLGQLKFAMGLLLCLQGQHALEQTSGF